MADIIQIRRDTAANFTAANIILAQGEPALEVDTLKEKIGDGITAWNSLGYRFVGGGTPGPGGGSLEFQPEITSASTTLTNTQKGLSKVYPFKSATAQTITVNPSVYVENDVINLERRGYGSVEIVQGTGVRFRGVRDVDNRFFINDTNSIVALLCRGGNEFSIIGNLKRGSIGAVNTTSYGLLKEGEVAKDVTVIGTGFSENMIVTVSANAIQSSPFTYVSKKEIVLHLTAVGAQYDEITITYDNGDVFTDAAAIIIRANAGYDVADLRAYYRLISDSDDYKSTHDGVATGVTYSAGAIFDGSTSYIIVPGSTDLSFGNGTVDQDLSISFSLNVDSFAGTPILLMKRIPGSLEYQIDLSGGYLRALFYNNGGASSYLLKKITHSFLTGVDYHVVITKTGTTVKFYIDGVLKTTSSTDVGSYIAMKGSLADFGFGSNSYSPYVNKYDGKVKRVGIWGSLLNQDNVDAIYLGEVTNDINII